MAQAVAVRVRPPVEFKNPDVARYLGLFFASLYKKIKYLEV